MKFTDRPKISVNISGAGQIEPADPSALDGFNDVERSGAYSDSWAYLLAGGGDYEFGYADRWYDDVAEAYVVDRSVMESSIAGGFPNGTTGLTMSYVAGKHNFVSCTASGSASAPETGGTEAFAVGPHARALKDWSMAVGRGARAEGVGSAAVGHGALARGPWEFAFGPASPMLEASFGVLADTGISETDLLRHATNSGDTGGALATFGESDLGSGMLGVVSVTLDLCIVPSDSYPVSMDYYRRVVVDFDVAVFAAGTATPSTPVVTTMHAGEYAPAPVFSVSSGSASSSVTVSGVANARVFGTARVKRMEF